MAKPAAMPARNALEMAEETYHVLRASARHTLPYYYLGAAPFVAGAIYFWADLRRHPFAEERTAFLSLGLVLLFIWMKAWQSLFARRIHAAISEIEPEPLAPAALMRLAVRQAFLHSLALVLLPLCLLIVFPFGWAYALVQSYTLTEDGSDPDGRAGLQRAWRMAQLWPAQNHLLIWLYSPYVFVTLVAFFYVMVPILTLLTPAWMVGVLYFQLVVLVLLAIPACPIGVMIALNIAGGIFFVPQVIQWTTGFRTLLVDGVINPNNSTLLMVITGLTYLCLDPLMKTAYVLRAFQGESQQSGADLRLGLRQALRRAAMALLAVGLACGAALAQTSAPAPVDPQALNQALEQELGDTDYVWREAVKNPLETSESSIARFIRSIGKVIEGIVESIFDGIEWVWEKIEKFLDWLFGSDRKGRALPNADGLGTRGLTLRTTMILVSVALALMLLYLALRIRRARQAELREAPTGPAPPPMPDLTDERTTAADLPEDAWLKLARELMDKGEHRLAARALFLATLATLARREWIRIARFKSNRDYQRELRRYAHQAPELGQRFADSMGAYEAVWYGAHLATVETCEAIDRNREALSAHG